MAPSRSPRSAGHSPAGVVVSRGAGSAGRAASPPAFPASESPRDPPTTPRILLRGECSSSVQGGSPPFHPGPSAAPPSALLHPTVRPMPHSPGPAVTAPCSDPAVAAAPLPSRRLRSIVVAPPLPISGKVGQWSEVVRRRGRVALTDPLVTGQRCADNRQNRLSGRAAAPPAFLSKFRGRCFRCLRSHAVTLSAADGVNASSPMAVGRALEAQLAVPEHSLRVTAHHPEHYLVIFTQPA
ncbi:hypothetical protein ZWY2020_048454 [Hordeum vulgare]|nr:hypothetical protein ZWY2020_048454 [Hordeum vulgare]